MDINISIIVLELFYYFVKKPFELMILEKKAPATYRSHEVQAMN